MKYRKFGKLDWKASVLGFGTMRLPVLNNDYGKIDEPESIKMIRYAIDHGVNYIDSAYPYHNEKSEIVCGKALKDGYREKIRIATKQPGWFINSAADFDKIFNEQLKRWQTDRFDFYLLHGLNKVEWPKVRDFGVFKWAEHMIADGYIGHLGFSFHDDYDLFQEIVDSYDNWTFCQIQYNYMDEEFQAGTRGLKYAHKKGLAVIVMEPVRGGRLAKPPEKVAKIFTGAPVQRTPPEWALRWVLNHHEVTVALSGMSNMQQVIEDIGIAEQSSARSLTADELALIGRARDTYLSLSPISCTACKYCSPCPNGVDIPHVFDLYNQAMMYNDAMAPRWDYAHPNFKEHRADKCTKCEECLEKCPQKLPIPELLEKAHEFLTRKE
jgi:hypothetical protein